MHPLMYLNVFIKLTLGDLEQFLVSQIIVQLSFFLTHLSLQNLAC